jgi:hypothetical protein
MKSNDTDYNPAALNRAFNSTMATTIKDENGQWPEVPDYANDLMLVMKYLNEADHRVLCSSNMVVVRILDGWHHQHFGAAPTLQQAGMLALLSIFEINIEDYE